jgi:protein-S-isoprenylcysteine O-methyltransferase Ste14
MTSSRSTPRLRLTTGLLALLLALVAISERRFAAGLVGEALQLAGLACVACAALGRIWTSVFIAGFKDQVLVRSGPYAVVRHPLYALSMLAMLGLGLATGSIAITLALLVVFGAIYAAAARDEDRYLRELHGVAHEHFEREVRAVLPRWSAYAVADSLEIRPRVLWKSFLDAGSLLGFYGLLRVADALQQQGVTPTWLTLA